MIFIIFIFGGIFSFFGGIKGFGCWNGGGRGGDDFIFWIFGVRVGLVCWVWYKIDFVKN